MTEIRTYAGLLILAFLMLTACKVDNDGEVHYADSIHCDKGNWPVCAAETSREPCDEARCPALLHTTFATVCAADEARASVLFAGGCGELEGSRVLRREVTICPPKGYPPVCALEAYPASQSAIDCLAEPCYSHVYRTHYTPCSVAANVATKVFPGECATLQDVETTGEPPVEIIGVSPETGSVSQVVSASIDGDLLTVVLAYSGCSEQHFRLLMDGAFMESYPVQVRYSFQPVVVEFCRAHFETEFVYDLKPLKARFQEAYQIESGDIYLPGLANYHF